MKRNISKTHKWNMADTVTSVRIAFSVFLLFLPIRSLGFIAAYTFAGISDLLDGWLARKTKTASQFGAKLDSVADLLFYSIVLLRLFPVLYQMLPGEIWFAVSAVLIVRFMAYTTAAVKYHRFASLHTWMNKLTGASVFFLPYILIFTSGVVYSWVVCILALTASTEELLIHMRQKEYHADMKSFLQTTAE